MKSLKRSLTTLFLFVFTAAAVILSPIGSQPAKASDTCILEVHLNSTKSISCRYANHFFRNSSGIEWVTISISQGVTIYQNTVSNTQYYGSRASVTTSGPTGQHISPLNYDIGVVGIY
jgi:hypothetical protein